MAVTPVGVLPLHRHGPALMDGLLGRPKMQSRARVQVREFYHGIGLALRDFPPQLVDRGGRRPGKDVIEGLCQGALPCKCAGLLYALQRLVWRTHEPQGIEPR